MKSLSRFAGFAVAVLTLVLALALSPVRPVIATLKLNETPSTLTTTATLARAGPVVGHSANSRTRTNFWI